MRQAINQMANDAVQYYFSRRHFDYEFMLASRVAGPLYCSASDDFKAKDCQRMIGWAVQTSYAFLEPPVNSPGSEKRGLLDDKSTPSIYMALVRDESNTVSRLNFTSNKATSVAQFNALVGENRKYKAGMVFSNVSPQKTVVAKLSAFQYDDKDMDIYEIWAQYLQDVCSVYLSPITNEKMTSLVTIKSREAARDAELTRMMKPLKEIKSQQLFQNYQFWLSVVQKDDGKLLKHNIGHSDDLGKAVDRYERYLKANYVNKDIPIDALFYVKEAGAISCSAGMSSRVCQRMVGEALRSYNLGRSSIEPAKPVYMSYNTPEQESRYFALVKDLKTDEVKKYNLTLRDQPKAVAQFEKLTQDADKIGALGFNGMPGDPRWIKFQKHNGTSADVDVALAEFAQQRLNRFLDQNATLESIGLLTKEARDIQVAQYKKQYL